MPPRTFDAHIRRTLMRQKLDCHDKAACIIDAVKSRPLWTLDQKSCRTLVDACLALSTGDAADCSVRSAAQRQWLSGKRGFPKGIRILLVDTAVTMLARCYDLPAPELHACRAVSAALAMPAPPVPARPGQTGQAVATVTRLSEARACRAAQR